MKTSHAVALVLMTAGLATAALAKPWWMRGIESNENDFLPPDVAFRVGAAVDGSVLHVRWVIANGYYLYRNRLLIQAESPDLVVAAPMFPRGIVKQDPYLGEQEIFVQQVEGTAAFTRSDAGAHPLQIKVTYQGCADAGLCYPPITKVLFPSDGTAELRPAAAVTPARGWEKIAIGGGLMAFLLAGWALRRGRHLATPG